MRKFRSIVSTLGLVIVVAVITAGLLTAVASMDSNEKENTRQGSQTTAQSQPQEAKLVALGDSLTEGVGDASRRGGYVPITVDLLEDTSWFSHVDAVNAGKSGATASEIMNLVQADEKLEEQIASADMIALSVGGNNLVHTFSRTGLNASKESFEAPLEDYEKELIDLFTEIKKWNDEAPLYVFGIYNPYYYYFAEIEPLQQIVDVWNTTTKEAAGEFEETYFIPIDHLFNSTESVVSGEEVEEPSENTEEEHPYLFEGDYFHPNEEGYRIMARALVRKVEETWQ